MEKITLKVLGMSCGHCKKAVEGSVGALDGVSLVQVNLDQKEVEVEFNPDLVDVQTIKDIIDDAGYEVV